jgi:hypothetical protein
MRPNLIALSLTLGLFSAGHAMAQNAAGPVVRPPLVFREEFNERLIEEPLTMASIGNKALRFATYGQGKDQLGKNWHPNAPQQGSFLFTGSCLQVCGFTLYLPDSYLDLRGLARVVWRTSESGLHQLHLLIKTADGKLLISDQSVSASGDWRVSDLVIGDLKWRELEPKALNDLSPKDNGPWLPQPDLSKVSEIGFVDPTPGSGHHVSAGSSRVAWIEVYGNLVPRK